MNEMPLSTEHKSVSKHYSVTLEASPVVVSLTHVEPYNSFRNKVGSLHRNRYQLWDLT